MDNINVVFADMPTRIKAFTRKNSDSSYTIVLNSLLSREQNLLSYQHEIDHIQNGDYDTVCTVNMIEVFAHGG